MRRILVVEDEYLLAAHIEDLLVEAGVEVIGPVGTLEEALKLAKEESMHGALLDVNILGGRIDDVAAILAQRAVPFVFVTGYGRANLPPLFRDAVVVAKPFDDADLLREVRQMGA